MINKIEADMTEEVVRSALKRNVKQFNHMLKCDTCMDRYIEILLCMTSDQRIKGRIKFKDTRTIYQRLHNIKKEKKK